MARTELTATEPGTLRDHGFHPLRVGRAVRETADASSIMLEVSDDLQPAFVYQAGQFCNLGVAVGDRAHVRCYSYSMSSSLVVDDELQVTVKRVPGGLISNWLNDHLAPGDLIDVSPPSGFCQLTSVDSDVVAFAARSGITSAPNGGSSDPVVRASPACPATPRAASAAPGRSWRSLSWRSSRRGPTRRACTSSGSPRSSPRWSRRPTILPATRSSPSSPTILQTARQMGMSLPYSRESGSGATSMIKFLKGEVSMYINNALTADELADGWALIRRAVPTTASLRIAYRFEEG